VAVAGSKKQRRVTSEVGLVDWCSINNMLLHPVEISINGVSPDCTPSCDDRVARGKRCYHEIDVREEEEERTVALRWNKLTRLRCVCMAPCISTAFNFPGRRQCDGGGGRERVPYNLVKRHG
jgi:hypothetical protein